MRERAPRRIRPGADGGLKRPRQLALGRVVRRGFAHGNGLCPRQLLLGSLQPRRDHRMISGRGCCPRLDGAAYIVTQLVSWTSVQAVHIFEFVRLFKNSFRARLELVSNSFQARLELSVVSNSLRILCELASSSLRSRSKLATGVRVA